MPSDLSRKEASGGREMLPLQTNGKADRGGAAVVRSGEDWWGTYKATIDTGAYDGKLGWQTEEGGIDEQLEVEIAFGNTRLSMSLLILPGVVDSLVLGWNFLTQVGTEIKWPEIDTRDGSRRSYRWQSYKGQEKRTTRRNFWRQSYRVSAA